MVNPLSANLSTNCLSVFDHFVKLGLKDKIFPKVPEEHLGVQMRLMILN